VSDGAAAQPSTVVRAVFFGSGAFAVPILDVFVDIRAFESRPSFRRPIGRSAGRPA